MQTAKLFTNGKSQAVRLPKNCRFEGSEVYVRKMGDLVVLLPVGSGWALLEKSLDEFTDDFMEERAQPAAQERKGLK